MRQAGLKARLKRKKTQKRESNKNQLALTKEDIQRYKDFWNVAESSMRLETSKSGKFTDRSLAGYLSRQRMENLPWGLIDGRRGPKICWDVMMGVPIVFSILYVPLVIGFQMRYTEAQVNLDLAINVIFMLDILVNANTAFVDPRNENKMIANRWEILKEYAKFWFWADLFSSMPYDQIVSSAVKNINSIKIVKVVRLVRLLKLFRILKLNRLSAHFEKLNLNPQAVDVFTLVLQLMFVAHLICCFWYFLTTSDVTGSLSTDPAINPTWATVHGYIKATIAQKYVVSFYWTVATMLSVGYGDVTAANDRERLYAVFTMLSGGIMFGAVIAQVTRLIESRNPQARAFKMKMTEMKAYIAEKTLPHKLKIRAKEAYSYYLNKKSSFAEQGGILEELPTTNLIKLCRNVYEKEINRIKLFRKSEIGFVIHLVMRSNPFQVMYGEVIYEVGDVAEDISFIMNGTIRITTETAKKRTVIAGYAEKGGYTGDFEYLSKATRIATYTAATKCSLLSVGDQALDDAIAEFYDAGNRFKDELKQRFEMFKRVISLPICYGKDPYGNFAKMLQTSTSSSFIINPRGSFNAGNIPQRGSFNGGNNNGRRGSAFAELTGLDLQQRSSINGGFVRKRGGSDSKSGLAMANFFVPSTDDLDTQPEGVLAARSTIWVDGELKPPSYRVLEEMKRYREYGGSGGDSSSGGILSGIFGGGGGGGGGGGDGGDSTAVFYRVVTLRPSGREVEVEETVDEMGKRYLLHPRGTRKNVWDVLVGLFIIYSILMIPVQIAFGFGDSGNYPKFDMALDVLFFLDIIYCMRTAYFSEERDAFIAVHSKIYKQYLKTWFMVDILSCIPFDTIISTILLSNIGQLRTVGLIKAVRLTRLLKLARVVKLTKYEQKIEDEIGISPVLFDLIKMVCQVVFIGHLTACAWWGLTANVTKHGWMENLMTSGRSVNIRHASSSSQYITSMYWTFTTLTTTGYGDISASNMTEQALNVFAMILGATVFGYIVANVSTLMGNLNQAQGNQREKLAEITEFLNEKNCPKMLSGSIIRHFKHMFNQKSAFDEEGILSRLPRSIAVEISLLQHAETMKKIPILRHIPNKNQALYLFKMMSLVYYDAGQYLIREGEVATEILFIVSGLAYVYKKKPKFRNPGHITEKVMFSMGTSGKDPPTPVKPMSTFLKQLDEKKGAVDVLMANVDMRQVTFEPEDAPTSRFHRLGEMRSPTRRQTNLAAIPEAMTSQALDPAAADSTDNRLLVPETKDAVLPFDQAPLRKSFLAPGGNVKPRATPTGRPSMFTGGKSMKIFASKEAWVDKEDDDYNEDDSKEEELKSENKLMGRFRRSAGGRRSDDDDDEGDESASRRRKSQADRRKMAMAMHRSNFRSAVKGSVLEDRSDDSDTGNDEDERASTKGFSLYGSSSQSKNFDQAWESSLRSKGRIPLGTVTSGDFVGHVAMMRHGRHTATVKVVHGCSVYVLKRSDINKLLKDHPCVAMTLQSVLGTAIHELNHDLGRVHVRKQRAEFLTAIREKHLEDKRKVMDSGPTTNKGSSTIFSSPSLKYMMGAATSTNTANTSSKDECDKSGEELLLSTRANPLVMVKNALFPAPPPPPPPPPEPKVSKWAIVRHAIRDAKVTATVAKMAENKAAMTSEDSGVEMSSKAGRQAVAGADAGKAATKKDSDKDSKTGARNVNNNRRSSIFALAIKARMVAHIDVLLSDENIYYDTEEELDDMGEQDDGDDQVAPPAKGSKAGEVDMRKKFNVSKAKLKSHRSCSDLTRYGHTTSHGSGHGSSGAVGGTGGDVEAMAPHHGYFDLANDVRPRRQSYPSLDNHRWKTGVKATSVV